MRLTISLLSSYKRLVSAVCGITKQDVRIQPTQLQLPRHSGEKSSPQTLEVTVGEDACFVTEVGENRQVLGEFVSESGLIQCL